MTGPEIDGLVLIRRLSGGQPELVKNNVEFKAVG